MVRRPRLSFALCALISGVVVSSAPGLAVGSAVAASDPPGIRAVRNGEAIDITDVARYHCHDRAYPIIRCFDTPAARDANERTISSIGTSDSGAAETSAASSPYVRWYADIGFGGSSFVAYIGYANLGDIGWNDKITSFATYSGGHPRWSQNVGFGGTRWDWGTVSVSYVGDAANDKFSSVERL